MCVVDEGGPLMDGWEKGEQGLEGSGSPSTGEGGGWRWRCPLGWNEVSTAAEHFTTDFLAESNTS